MTRIQGTALTVGPSRNNRYYSREAIRAAVEQAQPRVKAGQLLMRAHHDAADVLGYVGRVTALRVAEDGSAQFEGELADTSMARDVRALIEGRKPFVDSVSICGEWNGPVKRVNVGGRTCETAPGLVLHSIDFTASPGVDGARIRVAESISGARYFYEQAPGPVVPVPPERSEREWAGLTTEEFDQAAGDYWAGYFARDDQRRAERGPSPFWQGLVRGQAI